MKDKILKLLSSGRKDKYSPYDIALEFVVPLSTIIEALISLEQQQKIKPIGDALRAGEIVGTYVELQT